MAIDKILISINYDPDNRKDTRRALLNALRDVISASPRWWDLNDLRTLLDEAIALEENSRQLDGLYDIQEF